MDPSILKTVGQVAGIAGLSIGMLVIVFREVIRKNIFPTLTKAQGFNLLLTIVVFSFIVAIVGLLFSYLTSKQKPPETTVKVTKENNATTIEITGGSAEERLKIIREAALKSVDSTESMPPSVKEFEEVVKEHVRAALEAGKVTGSTEILVEKWMGIVIVDHPELVVEDGTPNSTGLHITTKNENAFPFLRTNTFLNTAGSYLEEGITMRRINGLVWDIIAASSDHDQPIIDVSVPMQRITDGVVQVVVTEVIAGTVKVVDNNHVGIPGLARVGAPPSHFAGSKTL